MELDKRIKEGKRPLTCFDVEEAIQFIGKECYFAHEIEVFENLDRCYFSRLLGFDTCDKSIPFAVANASRDYEFFIPEDWVLPEEPEKKYRAFSLNEFSELYAIGDVVTYRIKDCETIEQSMLIGFQSSDDEDIPGDGYVLIGNCRYSLKELFNNYELNYQNKWQPFGVIEDKE